MTRIYAIAALFLMLPLQVWSADRFGAEKAKWAKIAEETTPKLHERIVQPKMAVKAVKDDKAYQGWRFDKDEKMPLERLHRMNFKDVKSVTLDFGEHITGYCTLKLKTLNRCWDAPARLRITFAEMPAEMNTPFDPWPGSLSRGWMQDETIEFLEDEMDVPITLKRRLSMRYAKIELLGASSGYDFSIDDIHFTAVTSAGELQTRLGEGYSDIIQQIDKVGACTLKECMQTVFEDGPKRDHRLWIGDMYLESLANRYSFRNFQMTKHCLYLFASLANEDGSLICNLFEHPTPHGQTGSYLLPYNLLYIATLLEYYNDTKDAETANDLWEVCKAQMEDAISYVNTDGIFNLEHKPCWFFFDWREGLDIHACMQACTIDALQNMLTLAQYLGKEKEVKDYPALVKKMKAAARREMLDKKSGTILSGKNKQLSVLSQAWMIRVGVLNTKEGAKAINTALATEGVVMPGTPYGTHYLIEAMMLSGMEKQAAEYVIDYWGGMVKKGADCFFEAYDPKDDMISPYNFAPLNSYCHAWSCTPIYFIHKYPQAFK